MPLSQLEEPATKQPEAVQHVFNADLRLLSPPSHGLRRPKTATHPSTLGQNGSAHGSWMQSILPKPGFGFNYGPVVTLSLR